MSSSVPNESGDAPRIRCETPKPKMAKADLLDRTFHENRAEYGAILKRASEIAGFNRDQTADALQVDPSQVSRWWAGTENAQTWRYRRHPKLREAYLLAQAESEHDKGLVEVETTVRIRRRA